MPQQTNNAMANSNYDPVAIMPTRVRVGRDASHCKKEPSIKLNMNGETIESIQITCSCGEEIVVNCVYQGQSK